MKSLFWLKTPIPPTKNKTKTKKKPIGKHINERSPQNRVGKKENPLKASPVCVTGWCGFYRCEDWKMS